MSGGIVQGLNDAALYCVQEELRSGYKALVLHQLLF